MAWLRAQSLPGAGRLRHSGAPEGTRPEPQVPRGPAHRSAFAIGKSQDGGLGGLAAAAPSHLKTEDKAPGQH